MASSETTGSANAGGEPLGYFCSKAEFLKLYFKIEKVKMTLIIIKRFFTLSLWLVIIMVIKINNKINIKDAVKGTHLQLKENKTGVVKDGL